MNDWNSWSEVFSIIGTIVLMIAVFAAAYFVSKYVGKRYKSNYGSSKHITVIDSTIIGKDRSLLIVKAGEQAFLIGSAPNEFTLISEIDAQQFAVDPEIKEPAQKDFVSTFRDVIKSRIKKSDDGEEN